MTQTNEEEEVIPFYVLSPIQRAYSNTFLKHKMNIIKKGTTNIYEPNKKPEYNRIKEIMLEIEKEITK